MLDRLLKTLGGAKLAAILILLLLTWCAIGAALPQEGSAQPAVVDSWQLANPWTSALLDPLGGFHAFRSWFFIAMLALLFLNLAVCTIDHLWRGEAYRKSFIERLGFIFVHLSLLGLILGGMLSAFWRWDVNLYLIEGQTADNAVQPFNERTTRLFTNKPPPHIIISLNNVIKEYKDIHYTTRTASEIDLNGQSNLILDVNQPFNLKDLFITQDETGYAPGIKILDTKSDQILADSWLALKFDRNKTTQRHRDITPGGFGLPEMVLTLYPAHELKDGQYTWTGEAPLNPLLHIVSHEYDGQELFLPVGESGNIGRHLITFKDLRRWSKFRLMDDPGYKYITWSLWLALAALLLRYLPGVVRWLKESSYE